MTPYKDFNLTKAHPCVKRIHPIASVEGGDVPFSILLPVLLQYRVGNVRDVGQKVSKRCQALTIDIMRLVMILFLPWEDLSE